MKNKESLFIPSNTGLGTSPINRGGTSLSPGVKRSVAPAQAARPDRKTEKLGPITFGKNTLDLRPARAVYVNSCESDGDDIFVNIAPIHEISGLSF